MKDARMKKLQSLGPLSCLLFGLVLLGGCSGDEDFRTAEVQGQVLCQGQPVPGAVVLFRPVSESGTAVSGKPANGNADESGRFVLSTYEIGDGAVVGKHYVSVTSEDPNAPLPGKTPDDLILEVQPGSNDLTIELVP